MRFATLPEALGAGARRRRGLLFLEAGGAGRRVGYAELLSRALQLLHAFQSHGVRAGDEMVLCMSRPAAFVEGLWACLLGGIVAVPLAAGGTREHRLKVARVLASLHRPALFADLRSRAWIDAEPGSIAGLGGRPALLAETVRAGGEGRVHAACGEDVALLQFSSGSTGEPKGVVLSHRNLLANIEGIRAGIAATADDVFLSWMPLTHDMGLVGFHLGPLVLGAEQVLMPTELFVRRPLRWLEAASEARASVLAAPNFGVRHAVRALAAGLPAGLDLSRVRLVFNGAEPIDPALCQAFGAALAPASLAPTAMFPVYGLAEATLAVALPVPGAPLEVLHAARDALGCGARLRDAAAGSPDALALVAVGRPIAGLAVRLVGPSGAPVAEGVVGRLQVRGSSVTSGYYRGRLQAEAAMCECVGASIGGPVAAVGPASPADAAPLLAGGWLETGDLAVRRGALFIVGRSKDTLIVNGQNLHAHDLEQVCERHAGISAGRSAVVAARLRQAGEAVVVFVQHRGPLEGFGAVAAGVAAALAEHAAAEVAAVVPVRTLPRTTSGKLQRFALREAFERGEHDDVIATLAALAVATPVAAARSPTEAQLVRICEEVIDGRAIAVDANLLDLGCDSLALAEIHAALDALFPGLLQLEDFYDYPTIAALAAHLDAASASARAAAASAAAPARAAR